MGTHRHVSPDSGKVLFSKVRAACKALARLEGEDPERYIFGAGDFVGGPYWWKYEKDMARAVCRTKTQRVNYQVYRSMFAPNRAHLSYLEAREFRKSLYKKFEEVGRSKLMGHGACMMQSACDAAIITARDFKDHMERTANEFCKNITPGRRNPLFRNPGNSPGSSEDEGL